MSKASPKFRKNQGLMGLILLSVTTTVHADLTIDPSLATEGAIAPSALINKDLKAHTWSIHPTVGYISGAPTTNSDGTATVLTGWGGTAEAQYSMSDHIGIEYSALYYKGSGSDPTGLGTTSINGWFIGATLVLDPFSSRSSFRWPFFFGINYAHVQSSNPTGSLTGMTLNSPGYAFGFSPRFNLAFLRLEPFFLATQPLTNGNTTYSEGSQGTVTAPSAQQLIPVMGVNVVYRPWNLGFYVNLSSMLLGTGVSFYALGPTFTF